MVPVAGSAYTYAYATLGELFAWIIGWDLVLEYAVASSTVAHGWSHYFMSFLKLFGISIPAHWAASPIDFDPATHAWGATGSYCNLPAGLVVLLITVILVIGIRESARFNAAMVILKLVVVLFVIAVGSAHIRVENWTPFLPYRRHRRLQGRGLHLLRLHRLRLGLDACRGGAQPATRRADRHHPFAAHCARSCTSLVAAVLTGMVPYKQIDLDAPWRKPSRMRGLPVAVFLISARRRGRHYLACCWC